LKQLQASTHTVTVMCLSFLTKENVFSNHQTMKFVHAEFRDKSVTCASVADNHITTK